MKQPADQRRASAKGLGWNTQCTQIHTARIFWLVKFELYRDSYLFLAMLQL